MCLDVNVLLLGTSVHRLCVLVAIASSGGAKTTTLVSKHSTLRKHT